MISRSVLLKMKHPSDIRYRENQTIYFMLNNFLVLKIVPLYETMWKYVANPDRLHMAI